MNGFEGPVGGYALGISVTESTAQAGLVVTEVVEMGNAALSGIERGDIIIAINGQVPWRVSNLMDAKNTDRLTLRVLSKSRDQYEFAFPIPLRQPEVHFCGLLFEKEPTTGQFVVTGVVRGSEAAKIHFPVGSVLSTVHDIPTVGKSDSEVRKLLFGKGGDVVQIGAHPPGWPSIIDVQLPRLNHLRPAEPADNYCDGWSEKAFDEEYCGAKALNWLENNPPHFAEHCFEDDQIVCLHDERIQGPMMNSDLEIELSTTSKSLIQSHVALSIEDLMRDFRDRQVANDYQIQKAISDATEQISGALAMLHADFEQRRRDRAQCRELTQQVENLQKTVILLQAAGDGGSGANGFARFTS